MPLYEYSCQTCGADFEKLVRFSEADQLPACPECQSAETRKKISRIAFMGPSSGGFPAASSNSSCGSRGGFS